MGEDGGLAEDGEDGEIVEDEEDGGGRRDEAGLYRFGDGRAGYCRRDEAEHNGVEG